MVDIPPDIEDLSARINEAKNKRETKTKSSPAKIMAVNVLQITLEMLSPVIVAACMGYVLDNLFNTLPFIMLVMIIFGIAAGVLNAYRVAQKLDKEMKED